jgi:precorrin-6Y C5,15-methyltransferase (decarboxylating)
VIPIHVVGVGMGLDDLGPRLKAVVAGAEVLAGGRRMLEMFPEHEGRRIVLETPLEDRLKEIEDASAGSRVVVLASGDPLCYGIGARLAERFAREHVILHPNVSTVQAAFARLGLPWPEAGIVSMHAREPWRIAAALAGRRHVALFTDPNRTPGVIARFLLDRDQEDWRMWVLENLGRPEEKVESYSLAEAAEREFSPLNIVVLERMGPERRPLLGAADDAYVHQAGLITKAEVRAVVLARLEPGPGLTLWDLGAGCGSVGLEASLLMPGGRIIAVEQYPERVEQIRANRKRFQTANLEVVCGRMPEALEGLPDPDRVFAGGGGERLPDILRAAFERLEEGVVVAAVIRLESLEAARRTMTDLGAAIDVVQVQVSRDATLGGDVFLKALNPVWLVTGRKGPREEGKAEKGKGKTR